MSNPINEKVGAWLLDADHTRAGLAEAIGISRPALANRLDGSAKWNWDEIVTLANVLGTTLNELAGIEEGD